jgi:hypothetical protein
LQYLFHNEAIPLMVWPWLFLGGLVFFLVVEIEKLVIRLTPSLRVAVTSVEAGGPRRAPRCRDRPPLLKEQRGWS